jgi:LytR cell envelope-related transcriptional attenuator
VSAGPSGIGGAASRGVIVLVVVTVVGIALLAKAGNVAGSPQEGSAAPHRSGTTTTTAAPPTGAGAGSAPQGTGPTTSTVPATPHLPANVKVIVVNAAKQAGVGNSNNKKVGAAGFPTLEVTNAPAQPTTTIYYAPGYQADADAVKQALGFDDAPVQPAPVQPIVPQASEANVIVVLGRNYQGG